jgi:peptidoglycan hydrolase CwlO-like protein
MKREELTPIDLECNMGPDVNGVVQREHWKAYDIDEVDILIDKKDSEINELRDECAELHNRVATLLSQIRIRDERIDELKAKLETVQASAYADSVDAGMRERRLNRALWIARANRAHAEAKYNHQTARRYEEHKEHTIANCFDATVNKWQEVDHKCRAKAEEYR